MSDESSSNVIGAHTLDVAVQRGLLSREQVDALWEIERGGVLDKGSIDDEQFRFIRGFGDIFVTIGLAMFLGAIAYFSGVWEGSWIGFVAIAAASWLLAEYFTRIRRMALPSIALLLAFAASTFGAVMALTADWFQPQNPVAMIAPGAMTALAAWLHYRRFRVPITIAAGAAGVAAVFVGVVGWIFETGGEGSETPVNLAILLAGIAAFALAMRFDLSDRKRVTRRTDIAFWLHMLAAPMIVHPLISTLFGGGAAAVDTYGVSGALGILAVFTLLTVIALIVDRRAILVSGLAYAGIAFSAIAGQAGLTGEGPWALLVLGAFVLILSAGWQTIRQYLLALLPQQLSGRFAP